MAGLYRRCIVHFCFCVVICSVTAENGDAGQGDAHFETTTSTTDVNADVGVTETDISVSDTDFSVYEGIYTSTSGNPTSENPNSEMMNSAAVKTNDFPMSTFLPMPGSSRPRNAISAAGRKRQLSGQSGQDSNDPYHSAPGVWEETGQRESLEDFQPRGSLEDIQQRDSLEDNHRDSLEDNHRDSLGDNHRDSLGDIHYRDSLEDIQQKENPEEAGQRHTPEVSQQIINVTDNEVSPNKTMQEIIDSLNEENRTLIGSDIMNLENVTTVATTLLTTEGYTRKRWPPTPIQPPKDSAADMHAEKMESRANHCSMPVWLLCLLCLCRWTF